MEEFFWFITITNIKKHAYISCCTKILSRKKYMTLNIKLKLWIIRRQMYDKFLTHNEIIIYLLAMSIISS